jgi:hypothetical protein
VSYKVKRTVYKLHFADPDYEGMEVRVRAMSMADRLHAAFDLAWDPDDDMPTRRGKQQDLHAMFLSHIADWNLTEEDDTPVPVTMTGLLSLEPDFLGTLVGVWQMGRAAIPAPLDSDSSSGEPSPVESILAELPSENLAS